jgi:hypothetical protein
MTEQERQEEAKVEHGMTEQEFQTCMAWFDGASGKTVERYLTLNIGEMNMLIAAIEDFEKNLKAIEETEDGKLAKECGYGTYESHEEDCNSVLKKIREAQLDFFNNSLSTDEIRYTQIHRNVGGTIQ